MWLGNSESKLFSPVLLKRGWVVGQSFYLILLFVLTVFSFTKENGVGE